MANPVDLLFRLYNRFIPMEGGEYAKSREEGMHWWNGIRTDENAEVPKGHLGPTMVKVKKFTDTWYGTLTCGALYILLINVIQEYINPETDAEKYVD